ncbi:NEDD4-binding protein 2-like 2 [Eumeta japonica]|uniref:NEDD4-binding protein 2-like 2 n=1 Tax=Eumeta variegata TaxID=151549 RepID=A0A4C1ZRG8_EUMVA|nr:NEDD4-binding protein 2-like 2 [Eumeta japonica]
MEINTYYDTQQLDRIKCYNQHGYRTLVLMRGLPGSGKSYLANYIINVTVGASEMNYKMHIMSTDDLRIENGKYQYNRSQNQEVVEKNEDMVKLGTMKGLSPIVVDNTNLNVKSILPFLTYGVSEGYYIEFVMPHTPWSTDFNALVKKNQHGSKLEEILHKMSIFEEDLTPENVMKAYGLNYPPTKSPPVLRNIPPVRTICSST